MKFLECDLEEIIYKSNKDDLSDRGLTVLGKLLRQVRIGNYGVADLIEINRPYIEYPFELGIKHPLKITIYELKKDKIGVSAFLQSLNYARGVQRYLELRGYDDNYIIEIVLIGKTVDTNGSLCFIPDIFSSQDYQYANNVSFYTYDYKFDGIQFNEESGYNLKHEGFKL